MVREYTSGNVVLVDSHGDKKVSKVQLKVIFIDTGRGDSILIESTALDGSSHYALVDCGDNAEGCVAKSFLKRYLERKRVLPRDADRVNSPVFEYVFLTHAHSDHYSGLRRVINEFGTKNFHYSLCSQTKSSGFALLYGWITKKAQPSNKVTDSIEHLDVESPKLILGAATITVLWPPRVDSGAYHSLEENNNSLVLQISLNDVNFVLTGDCEAHNFDVTRSNHVRLPKAALRLVQVPHHGARNGVYDNDTAKSSFLEQVSGSTTLSDNNHYFAISCHTQPYSHPNSEVASAVSKLPHRKLLRTDVHHDLVICTDGIEVRSSYLHEETAQESVSS